MKSRTIKLLTAFFVVAALISLSFINKAKVETPKPVYTGHWVAVSGDEYIEVESAEISDDAFQKDAKGKVQHIDEKIVARKLNFRQLSNIEGKKVDKHYFIIGQDEATDAVGMVTPKPKKVWGNCDSYTEPYINYCKAIYECMGITHFAGWATYNRCGSGNNNFCVGYQIGFPATAPYMYYVMCTTTN